MNIRERSSEFGFRLAQAQKDRAWPGATDDDMPYVVSDAIANLLVYVAEDLGEDIDTIIDRARMHAEAELGDEGEEPA